MAADIQLPGVCERDIDLLLLEEIASSPAFVEWLLTQLGLPAPGSLQAAARSVTTSNGESDLEVTVEAGGELWKLLVENKVAAVLQPRQGERYAERASLYLDSGECERVATVLIAPERYFSPGETFAGFDHQLTYEAVRGWFEARPADPRRDYKLLLLRAAIERGGSRWVAVPDETATEFHARYWQLATDIAPELRMPRPADKPATSRWVYFKPQLPKHVYLIHKAPYGNVDLQFAHEGANIEALRRAYAATLEPGMDIAAAGKSAVVRKRVTRAGIDQQFDEAAVREGIEAARTLLAWFRRNQQTS